MAEKREKNFRPKEKDTDMLRLLTKATRDTVYSSEIDSELKAFCIPADERSDGSELKRLSRSPRVYIDADEFIGRLTAKKDWYNNDEEANRRRFEKLFRLMEAELRNLRVLKTGKVQIEIFVMGDAADGKTYGIKMEAVET